ncbi:hypothetical protein F5883DRAFT_406912, partial [Diaporthe sp. PMI_573]
MVPATAGLPAVFGEAVGHTKQPNILHVTLCHCWVQTQHYTLNPDTVADLKDGIEIEKPPNTFRDAINFASQLHNVGWIWIDSLGICQGGPDVEKDWLHEAALMQRVYRESYLNISATAAPNSGVGLYTDRDCRSLRENEVSLKIDGIPEGLRRCLLISSSHWDDLVNKAPVDFRAWVLQEQLLAPRVLHFCKGSIAWECGGFTRAEGHPTGLPRTIRLGDHKEPDPHIPERDLYGFELWARVVEMYSRINLKLASSSLYPGLRNTYDSAQYVSGLWRKYFESQLLWRVEPIFIGHDRSFQQPGRRPEHFRAPSFSWASVDAQ